MEGGGEGYWGGGGGDGIDIRGDGRRQQREQMLGRTYDIQCSTFRSVESCYGSTEADTCIEFPPLQPSSSSSSSSSSGWSGGVRVRT